ncbi:MAG: hypothetical protein QG670_2871 [Thermoproteota archaeon]|nr:hypothetical protein [Thermoproteota archaeon]
MSSDIKKAQHDILQVRITQTMIDWAKEQSRISTDRCFAGYGVDHYYDYDVLIEQFEKTILFVLRVGILLGKEMHNDEV